MYALKEGSMLHIYQCFQRPRATAV